MEPYIVTGLISAAGAYAAVWAHLSFMRYRMNEQKDMLLKHDTEIRELDKRTALCVGCKGGLNVS